MKIFIVSNGCPRRLLDSSRIAQYFILNGCQIVDKPQTADYIIFITCSFIKAREEQCWRYIDELKKYKGELIILGCLPEIIPTKFSQEFKGKYLSTKNLSKIDALFSEFKIKFSDIPDTGSLYPNPKEFKQEVYSNVIGWLVRASNRFFMLFTSRKSFFKKILKALKIYGIKTGLFKNKCAYLRVSNGCIENCSYCSIVKAIGKLTSKPIKDCVSEYKRFLDKGFREFVILGDNTGAYGLDIGSSFGEFLENLAIVSGNYDVSWHLEQIHPRWIFRYKTEILKMVKEKKVRKISCSIQSGSNRILKLMNRHHTIEEITEALLLFRKYNSELKLRTDIIVGFPSETEEDFRATLDAIKKIQFNYVFVYPYYDGYETIASNLDNKIGPEIMEKRMKIAERFLDQEGILEQ